MKDFSAGAFSLELKYCERCGGLGFRPRGSDLIFCRSCTQILAGVAPNTNLSTHVRHRSRSLPGLERRGFWGEGGKA
jgi:hypothetical protein